MTGKSTVVALVALGAAIWSGISAATPQPYLRSVSAHHRHVVAVFTLGDLAPGKILVAVSRATGADGALLPQNVRLQEPLAHMTRVQGGFRIQTRHTLRPRRYFVQVSGTVLGVDCTPRKPCPTDWSNVRRVIIPRP
jgi:hypothetical protein